MLSAHFSRDEARLPPTPDPALLLNALRMAAFLEQVRSVLGDEPLRITSWYRDPDHNARVGGSPTSAHLTALAVDFKPAKTSIALAFNRLLEKPRLLWDQLIEERTTSGAEWLHIGLAPAGKTPRQQVLRARGEHLAGRMTYTEVV